MARPTIAESLLEMHYFRALLGRYKRILGPNDIKIFKPSTVTEKWYGFDQAYFRSNSPQGTVINDLKSYIHSGKLPQFTQFYAFLLQFKVVEMIERKSALLPANFSTPYYRSELSLAPNKETNLSQHETLRKASTLPGASVSYVCPMIFDDTKILQRPKLKDLRFVKVDTSPTGWLTNQRHFIAFQSMSANPMWCSDPILAELMSFEEVVRRAKPFNADEIQKFLVEFENLLGAPSRGKRETDLVLPSCLSIVAVG